MPFERVMGPNRHKMENYGDLQPTARGMKPTLWVQSENLSFASSLSAPARFSALHKTSNFDKRPCSS